LSAYSEGFGGDHALEVTTPVGILSVWSITS
jgi:hypothetical protein